METEFRSVGIRSPSPEFDLLLGFQPGRVGEILRPARSFLVEKKIVPADDWNAHSFQFDGCAIRIGSFKRDSAYLGNYIDAAGSHSDLERQARLDEILIPDLRRRRAKAAQRQDDPLCIVVRTSDPQIKILRSSWISVSGKRVCAMTRYSTFSSLNMDKMSRKSGFSNALSLKGPRIHCQFPYQRHTFCRGQPLIFGTRFTLVGRPDLNVNMTAFHARRIARSPGIKGTYPGNWGSNTILIVYLFPYFSPIGQVVRDLE